MANLTDRQEWTAAVRRIEPGDSVIGGAGAPINLCLEGINNRTVWLKNEIAKAVQSIGANKTAAENTFARKTTAVTAGAGLTGGGTLGGNMQFALGTPGTCSGSTTNWAGSDTHTHQIAAASATVAGVVKLISNLTTDDAESALSAAMGKKLQDEKLGKEGNQEISGSTFTVGNRSYPGYRLWSTSGNEGLLMESSGINTGHKFIVRRHNNGVFESSNIRSFSLPNINGDYTLAPTGLLTNQDLNTLTVPGLYGQNNNSNAQTARNYPAAKAGSLLVLPSAYGVQQIYSVFDATDIYARNQNGSGGWTAWQKTNVSPAEMQAAIAAVQSEKSDAINLDDSTKLATAKAVKTLNDKIDRATPAGEIAFFAGSTPPYGWLKANGAAVSRTAYRALFAAIGTTYGQGNGSSTFNLPDLRGEFIRGFDDGRNIDRSRALGSAQNQSMPDHYHGIGVMNTTDDILIVNQSWNGGGNEYPVMEMAGEYNKVLKGRISSARLIDGGTLNDGGRSYAPENGSAFHSGRVHHIATAIQDLSGGSETRPRNIALLACIKV